jgi:alpha-beta hydrolase superfamily lysophospholipase
LSSPRAFEQIDSHILRKIPDADLFIPTLSYTSYFSTARMADIAQTAAQQIETIVSAKARQGGGSYEDIVIIGHSMGGLLARYVLIYCWNCDQTERAKETPSARYAWSAKISRLVLLAGLNRGWTPETPIGAWDRLRFKFSLFLGTITPFGRPTGFDVRRGSRFLTLLRLNWLELKNRLAASGEFPVVVQLLGTNDDVVNPTDDIDLFTGRDFFYLEVPGSGHANILEVGKAKEHVHGRNAAELRREALSLAISGSAAELSKHQLTPDWMFGEEKPLTEDSTITDVVFIIHGIRDYGFWTQKIGREIRKLAQQAGLRVRIINPSYGYFPILPFLFPGVRREKAEWLMDKYVEARCLYPRARISYVGHSNGTYMLARAVNEMPMLEFDRVLFAGSVVRRSYPWARVIGRGVRELLNLVATNDRVVAFFPKGLQPLRIFDLGSAGHDGFRASVVTNSKYVVGEHNAGIGEEVWQDIARFIVTGQKPDTDKDIAFAKQRNWKALLLGMIATPTLLLGLLLACGLGVTLIASIVGVQLFASDSWIPPHISQSWWSAPWRALNESLLQHVNWAWTLMLAYAIILRYAFTKF